MPQEAWLGTVPSWHSSNRRSEIFLQAARPCADKSNKFFPARSATPLSGFPPPSFDNNNNFLVLSGCVERCTPHRGSNRPRGRPGSGKRKGRLTGDTAGWKKTNTGGRTQELRDLHRDTAGGWSARSGIRLRRVRAGGSERRSVGKPESSNETESQSRRIVPERVVSFCQDSERFERGPPRMADGRGRRRSRDGRRWGDKTRTADILLGIKQSLEICEKGEAAAARRPTATAQLFLVSPVQVTGPRPPSPRGDGPGAAHGSAGSCQRQVVQRPSYHSDLWCVPWGAWERFRPDSRPSYRHHKSTW